VPAQNSNQSTLKFWFDQLVGWAEQTCLLVGLHSPNRLYVETQCNIGLSWFALAHQHEGEFGPPYVRNVC